MSREAKNTAGNTEAIPQKEPLVTKVTPVSGAALQAPLRADCQRKNTINKPHQGRHSARTNKETKELQPRSHSANSKGPLTGNMRES